MLTMVFSGPPSAQSQVRNALVRRGVTLAERSPKDDPTFGFPESDEAYIACEGPDLDVAVGAVEPLRWRLRSHFTNANRVLVSAQGALPGNKTLEERIADLEAKLQGRA